ncbi:hypothetical protein pipiens_011307 [Culex pipiens pipiens]|uniref:Peptidase S1 domain-containing protein n=1 Tax=Culex pipiens pipiens TaxID=38569 RepID=A0ABD1D6W7_CULPP
MLHQVALIALFCVQTLANPGCGVPRIKHQALIVRGSPTQPGEWPWHAGVYHRSGRNSQYACGGTLISAEFVVTAAHCMLDEGTSYRLTRKRLFVRLGVHNLDRIDSGAMQQFTIADIHMFGNFSRDNLHNDIALLELGEMVRMTDYVVPACVNRNVNLDGLKPDVGCLWTDPNEITLESVSGAIWPTEMPTGPPLNVSESADGRFLRTNDNISCDNDRSILGVRLGLRKKGESFYRIVGPLVDCESSEYARLTPEYLDWIESVVWPGETVNSIRNQIVNLARKPFSD